VELVARERIGKIIPLGQVGSAQAQLERVAALVGDVLVCVDGSHLFEEILVDRLLCGAIVGKRAACLLLTTAPNLHVRLSKPV